MNSSNTLGSGPSTSEGMMGGDSGGESLPKKICSSHYWGEEEELNDSGSNGVERGSVIAQSSSWTDVAVEQNESGIWWDTETVFEEASSNDVDEDFQNVLRENTNYNFDHIRDACNEEVGDAPQLAEQERNFIGTPHANSMGCPSTQVEGNVGAVADEHGVENLGDQEQHPTTVGSFLEMVENTPQFQNSFKALVQKCASSFIASGGSFSGGNDFIAMLARLDGQSLFALWKETHFKAIIRQAVKRLTEKNPKNENGQLNAELAWLACLVPSEDGSIHVSNVYPVNLIYGNDMTSANLMNSLSLDLTENRGEHEMEVGENYSVDTVNEIIPGVPASAISPLMEDGRLPSGSSSIHALQVDGADCAGNPGELAANLHTKRVPDFNQASATPSTSKEINDDDLRREFGNTITTRLLNTVCKFLRQENIGAAGRRLFDVCFTDEQTSTWCFRDKKSPQQYKVELIEEILGWLKTMQPQEASRNLEGFLTWKKTVAWKLELLDEKDSRELKNKVFVSRANIRRTKYKKKSNAANRL